jgi:hypothetical protein
MELAAQRPPLDSRDTTVADFASNKNNLRHSTVLPIGAQPCSGVHKVGPQELRLIAATILSLLRSKAWWIRVWDFPRVQLAALGVASLMIA